MVQGMKYESQRSHYPEGTGEEAWSHGTDYFSMAERRNAIGQGREISLHYPDEFYDMDKTIRNEPNRPGSDLKILTKTGIHAFKQDFLLS